MARPIPVSILCAIFRDSEECRCFYFYTYFVYNIGMKVKQYFPHLNRIGEILASQNGVLLTADLTRLGIPRAYLALLEQRGEIVKVSRGVYRAVNALEDELFSFQAVHRLAIYSHETALFLHDLSDRSPLFYSVSVPSGYHSVSLKQSGHKVFYVSRALLELGVIPIKSPHGNPIRATNLERTICDMLRSRNQMDLQVVYDALKRYVRRADKDLNLLYQYAQHFGVQKIVREYAEVLL